MSPRFLLLLGLMGVAACSVPADVGDEDASDNDSAISGDPNAPLDRTTHFASGAVDLTKYRTAGKAEWTAFRKLYESRHTRPNENDDLAKLEARVKDAVPTPLAGELTSFAALKAYTTETMWFHMERPPIIQDYKLINTALRNVAADPKSAAAGSELAVVEGYVKAAASALNALPPVAGVVHRRLFRSKCDATCLDSMVTRYAQGARVIEPSFVSTSEKEAVTCGFRGQMHFVITAKGQAHSLGKLSDFPHEAEALFPPGSAFKVDKVEKDVPIKCTDDTWFPGIDNKAEKAPTKEIIVHMSAETD